MNNVKSSLLFNQDGSILESNNINDETSKVLVTKTLNILETINILIKQNKDKTSNNFNKLVKLIIKGKNKHYEVAIGNSTIKLILID